MRLVLKRLRGRASRRGYCTIRESPSSSSFHCRATPFESERNRRPILHRSSVGWRRPLVEVEHDQFPDTVHILIGKVSLLQLDFRYVA